MKERALRMKANPTMYEKMFIDKLDLLGVEYQFQVVISRYIVDFLIGSTIYEIDGSSHDGKEIYDAIRDKELTNLGYKVVRIKNSDVKYFNFGYAGQHKIQTITHQDSELSPLEKIRIEKMRQTKSIMAEKLKFRQPHRKWKRGR